MSSPAITTVIKMMESLSEDVQEQVAEHLKEYLEDLQDELKWDNSFKKSQNKLIEYTQRAKREIAEPMDKKLSLSESISQFRQELIEEKIEINPDEVWGNISHYAP
jgi:translation initiation factor 2B subunit (eIF-2B alpha/beta/delta family)